MIPGSSSILSSSVRFSDGFSADALFILFGVSVLLLVFNLLYLIGVPEGCQGLARVFRCWFFSLNSSHLGHGSMFSLFLSTLSWCFSAWTVTASGLGSSLFSWARCFIGSSSYCSLLFSLPFVWFIRDSNSCATASSLGFLAHFSQFVSTSVQWIFSALSFLSSILLLLGDM